MFATKTTAMKMMALPTLNSCNPLLSAADSSALAFELNCCTTSDPARVRLMSNPSVSICSWIGASSLPIASSIVGAVPMMSPREVTTDEAMPASSPIATTTVTTKTGPPPRHAAGRAGA